MDSDLLLKECSTPDYSDLSYPATEGNETITGTGALFSKEWIQILDRCNTVVTLVSLIIFMLAMGSATYWRELVLHAKRPVGCIIGMVCQFGFFPAVGFGVSLALQLKPYEALSVLLICCSPGGALSNFFTYWVDGDIALSILMTSTSSLLALVGMPLNLWLYTQYWSSHELKVPYLNILTSLTFIAIPAGVGMVIRSYSRIWAERISKICGLVGWAFVILSFCLIFLTYWNVIIRSSVSQIVAAAAIPIVGISLAYIIAKILCSSHKVARTIGIETGCQNVPVALNVVTLSFSEFKIRGQLVLFPILYITVLLAEIFTLIIAFQCWKCAHKATTEETKSVIDNTVLTSVPVPDEKSEMDDGSNKGSHPSNDAIRNESETVPFLEPLSPTEKSTQTNISVPFKSIPPPSLPPGVPFLPKDNTIVDDDDDVDGAHGHKSLSRQSTLLLGRQESVSIVRQDSQRLLCNDTIPIGKNDLDIDDGRYSPNMRFNSFCRNQQ